MAEEKFGVCFLRSAIMTQEDENIHFYFLLLYLPST